MKGLSLQSGSHQEKTGQGLAAASREGLICFSEERGTLLVCLKPKPEETAGVKPTAEVENWGGRRADVGVFQPGHSVAVCSPWGRAPRREPVRRCRTERWEQCCTRRLWCLLEAGLGQGKTAPRAKQSPRLCPFTASGVSATRTSGLQPKVRTTAVKHV